MTTVVIVDDQFTSRKVLEQLVSMLDASIRIEAFGDPIPALDWLEDNTPDLILTDYKMPHIDGVEFTRLCRAMPRCTDTPLVMITCIEDRQIRYQALESGATDFLTKPIDLHECRARCNNLLTMRSQQRIIKDRANWLERRVPELKGTPATAQTVGSQSRPEKMEVWFIFPAGTLLGQRMIKGARTPPSHWVCFPPRNPPEYPSILREGLCLRAGSVGLFLVNTGAGPWSLENTTMVLSRNPSSSIFRSNRPT